MIMEVLNFLFRYLRRRKRIIFCFSYCILFFFCYMCMKLIIIDILEKINWFILLDVFRNNYEEFFFIDVFLR